MLSPVEGTVVPRAGVLDLVAVSNAPVTVDLIGLLGPVMCQALLGCRLINEVSGDRTSDDPHRKCLDDDECVDVLCFDHVSVVQVDATGLWQ
jgi:hypothetical protein